MLRGFCAQDLFVHPDIKNSKALPLGGYWHPEILEHEWYNIFPHTWAPLPKSLLNKDQWKDLEISGNRLPFRFYEQGYLFVRSFLPAGTPILNCFSNNCPHLGYPLLKHAESNQETVIRCGQHGLTTDCDGNLFFHPSFERGCPRASESLSLRQVQLRQLLDLVFLCRGSPIAPFEEFFGQMLETVAFLPLNEYKHISNPKEERTVRGNWKLHAMNYMDSLHIRYIHKKPGGLHDAVYMESYRTELFSYSALQWVYAKNSLAGFDWEYLPDRFRDPNHPDRKVFALWWFIFPNMAFNFYPWGLSINVYMPIAGDPLHSKFVWYHYVWDEKKYALRDDLWLSARTDREDINAIEKLQQNIQPWGPKFERGIFGDKEELEIGPHWFQRKWCETANIQK